MDDIIIKKWGWNSGVFWKSRPFHTNSRGKIQLEFHNSYGWYRNFEKNPDPSIVFWGKKTAGNPRPSLGGSDKKWNGPFWHATDPMAPMTTGLVNSCSNLHLKIFVIPKEGFLTPAQSSLCVIWHQLKNCTLFSLWVIFQSGVILVKGLAGLVPTSFGLTTTKILRLLWRGSSRHWYLCMLFCRYQGYISAALVLGGVDVNGPHLYSIYPHGSTDSLPYVTMGSGSLAAMAVFEDGYKVDMEVIISLLYSVTFSIITLLEQIFHIFYLHSTFLSSSETSESWNQIGISM